MQANRSDLDRRVSGAQTGRLPRSVARATLLLLMWVIPGVIVFQGFARLAERSYEQRKVRAQRAVPPLLDRFARLADPGIYLGRLLETMVARSQAAADPFAALARQISRLKTMSPDAFTVIVWDDQGRVVPALSDEKGYRVILRRLHQILEEVRANVRAVPGRGLPSLPIASQFLSTVRGFFGRFFVPSHLGLPYRTDGDLPLIRVDFETSRSFVWHRCGERFGLMVFLSEDIVRQNDGLVRSVKAFNRRGIGPWRLALLDPGLTNPFLVAGGHPHLREVLQAIKQEAGRGREFGETAHLIVGANALPDGRVLIAYASRSRLLPDLSRHILGLLVKVLLVYAAAAGMWASGLTRLFVVPSIRHELVLLFLFASGVPLASMVFQGGEYLDTWRESFSRSLLDDSERVFKHLDDRFGLFRAEFDTQIQREIGELVGATHLIRDPRAVFARLASLSEGILPDESYLLASGGVFLYSSPKRKLPALRERSLRELGNAALHILNGGAPTDAHAPAAPSLEQSVAYGNAVKNLLARVGGINLMISGFSREWVFVEHLRLPGHPQEQVLWIGAWTEMTIMDLFLRRSLSELRESLPGLEISAETGQPKTFVLRRHRDEFWQDAIEAARSRGRVFCQEPRRSGGHATVGLALASRQLPGLVFVASIAEPFLQGRQKRLLWGMTMGGVVLLLLAWAIGRGLAREFLLPLTRVQGAATMLQARNFHFEAQSDSLDEFGTLERTFAQVMGSLEELEVARIVQESLFPPNRLAAGAVRIFGHSEPMAALGGDFFDLFPHEPQRVVVVLGDVAGHGVAAALIMAIAKASLVIEQELWERPDELLHRLNAQLFALQKKPRKMVTVQVLCLDAVSGHGFLANAGQAYPLLVRAGQAVEVSLPSRPLGVTAKACPRATEVNLRPGDHLVMYSDGFIEAEDAGGEMVGYDRFAAVVVDTRQSEPEAFYQGFRRSYQAIVPRLNDDATMVIVSFDQLLPGEPSA
jgi:hypothetical protein